MMVDRGSRRFLSEINVVPLVDVVLVLLIIFMVTAPMLHRGIDLTLPTSESNSITPEERLVVTIERDQKMYLEKDQVTIIGLRQKLQQAKSRNPGVSVYLRSDRGVPYGRVVQVMDQVKGAGIDKLGMVTNPGEFEEETVSLQ